jgi:hypothetical protein
LNLDLADRVMGRLFALAPRLAELLDLGAARRGRTGLVDTLEADGLVRRRPCPGDRHATLVALTPEAETAFARLMEGYTGLARDLVDGVPAADQRCVVGVLDHISARMDDALTRGFAALQADPPALPAERGRNSGDG